MFVPLWLIFLLSGLAMAVFAVVWGIRSNQFEDQDRARFIPLVGLTTDEGISSPVKKRYRSDYAALYAMLAAGFGSIGWALWMVLESF